MVDEQGRNTRDEKEEKAPWKRRCSSAGSKDGHEEIRYTIYWAVLLG